MSPEPTSPDHGADAFLARLAIEGPAPILAAEAATGTVVAVNEAATELFGRNRSSLIGMHQTELHPPETETRHREGFQAVRDGREEHVRADAEEPVTILRADGSTVPVDVRSTTFTHAGTEYVLGIFQDASERTANLALLEQQAAAMDLTTSGIALLNGDGEYTYLNDAHVTMFGYDDAEELLGGTWRQIYADDVIELIETEVLPVVGETGSWDGELVGVKRDGTPITQRVSLAQLPDGGITCVNLDLTEQERRLCRLEETRSLAEELMTADDYEDVIETAIEGVTEIIDRPFSGYWAHEPAGTDTATPTGTAETATDVLVPVSVSSSGASLVEEAPRFRPGESLAWEAFDAGTPAYYPNVAAEVGVHNRETPIGTEFIIPIDDDGVFLVGSPETDDLAEDEREIILIITQYLRTAIELVAQRRQLRTARDRIESERNQLERVMNTVPQLIFAKNTDGEFLLANEAVADAYGTTVSEMIGSTDADYTAEPDEVDAFTDDDRRVIETGEPLHRIEETLTDAAGNERVLETWKIPFKPADSDDDAVLGVANDITDLTDARDELDRQRRLTNLYAVSNRVFKATDTEDAFDACVEAVTDVVTADEIAIYDRNTANGALVRLATAGDEFESASRQRVRPGETDLWRAFGEPDTYWLPADAVVDSDGSAEKQALVTQLGDTSLLSVVVDDRDESLESFIRAVSQQISAALTHIRQETSIEGLSGDVESAQKRADRYRNLWEGVIEAVRAIVAAETQTAVREAVVSFGDRVAEYAFVGTYDPVAERVDPVEVSEPGGPAKLYENDERTFPAVIAASQDERQRVVDGQGTAGDHGEWLNRLLHFGYRESLAVPVSHYGTVHVVAEFISTDSERFDEPERQAVDAVADAAGMRLSMIDSVNASNAPIVFDLECQRPSPLFPDLPEASTIVVEHVALTGTESFHLTGRIDGSTDAAFRDYVAATPGIELESIDSVDRDVHEIAVRMRDTPDRSLASVRDVLMRTDTQLSSVRSRPNADVLEFWTTDPKVIGRVREELSAVSDLCQLVSKRHLSGSSGRRDESAGNTDLTSRQREIVETALRQGYYDDPRGINGADLADRFDVSSSTLHQHLRAAESKIIRGFFE
ncbi:MAG: PAS domain-containing protein [Methanobacteriota archaeon]